MKDLIEALTILLKYGDPSYPFHCTHETIHVVGIKSEDVSEEDRNRLDELGFFCKETTEREEGDEWDEDEDGEGFKSYKYGSA